MTYMLRTHTETFTVQPGIHLIGRHSECEIRIDGAGVSRRHARLTLDDAVLKIEDLDSRNGIQVNSERISNSLVLKNGDCIAIGEVILTVSTEGAAGQAEFGEEGPGLDRNEFHSMREKRHKLQHNITAVIIIALVLAAAWYGLRPDETLPEKIETEQTIGTNADTDPAADAMTFDDYIKELEEFTLAHPLAIEDFHAHTTAIEQRGLSMDEQARLDAIRRQYLEGTEILAAGDLATIQAQFNQALTAYNFAAAQSTLEGLENRFTFSEKYAQGVAELKTRLDTEMTAYTDDCLQEARMQADVRAYRAGLAVLEQGVRHLPPGRRADTLQALITKLRTEETEWNTYVQNRYLAVVNKAQEAMGRRNFEIAVKGLQPASRDPELSERFNSLLSLLSTAQAGAVLKQTIISFCTQNDMVSLEGLGFKGIAGQAIVSGVNPESIQVTLDEGAVLDIAWRTVTDKMLLGLAGVVQPPPFSAMLAYAQGMGLDQTYNAILRRMQRENPGLAAEIGQTVSPINRAEESNEIIKPIQSAELTWPDFQDLTPAGSGVKQVKLQANRDVWVSGANSREYGTSMGKTQDLKLKGIQEMALVDFPFEQLKGACIIDARLVAVSRNGKREVERLKAGDRNHTLRKIAVSTVSSPWEEGTNTSAYQPAAGGGATFLEASAGSESWAWQGSRLFDVILGAGNSAVSWHELKNESGSTWSVLIDPVVVQAAVAGLGHGFCVMDASGQAMANNMVNSIESGKGMYLQLKVKSMPAKPGALQLQGKPYIQGAKLQYGAVLLTVRPGADTLGYLITVDGKKLEPWQVPPAGPVNKDQLFVLEDLAPDHSAVIKVTPVSPAGIKGEAAEVSVQTSPAMPDPGRDIILAFKPQGNAPVTMGPYSVWALPPFMKADPLNGTILYEPGMENVRGHNSLWDGSKALVRIAAAKGEIVSFKIAIEGDLSQVNGVGIACSALQGPETSIPASAVYIYSTWYVKTGNLWQGEYAVPIDGPISLPFKDNKIPGQKAHTMLADICIPYNIAPGTYSGTITVQAAGQQAQLKLEIPVYDVTIPRQLNFNPELNCYGGPDRTGSDYFNQAHIAAHYNRCTINRVPYSQTGRIHDDMIPALNGTRISSWDEYDRNLGPLLDGSLFIGNPRGPVPVRTFYLPFFENWPVKMDGNYNFQNKDRSNQVDFALNGPDIETAFSQNYQNGFKSVVRQFVEHYQAKGWDIPQYQMYLNNKPRSPRHTSYWRLDEPSCYDDYAAIAWYGRLFREGKGDTGEIEFVYRGDISRPQWQGRLFDGIMDIEYVGGSLFSLSRTCRILKQRMPTILYAYGSCNKLDQSNVNSAAWCLKAWFAEADGVLPWSSIGGKGSLNKADQNGLIVDARDLCGGPAASYRVKALKDGAQICELLYLAQAKHALPGRKALMPLIATELNLSADFKQAFADEAAAIDFKGLTGGSFVRLKEKLLILLTR